LASWQVSSEQFNEKGELLEGLGKQNGAHGFPTFRFLGALGTLRALKLLLNLTKEQNNRTMSFFGTKKSWTSGHGQ
jgi:hypothetical protein